MSTPVSPRRPVSFLGALSRSQIAAGIATAVDFGLLFLLVEDFRVWYVVATALGALAGAITNFVLNRHWSFRAQHEPWRAQALRYSLISGLSMLLNTSGTWAVTEGFHIHYGISVVAVSIAVALFVNFPLHRYFVFR